MLYNMYIPTYIWWYTTYMWSHVTRHTSSYKYYFLCCWWIHIIAVQIYFKSIQPLGCTNTLHKPVKVHQRMTILYALSLLLVILAFCLSVGAYSSIGSLSRASRTISAKFSSPPENSSPQAEDELPRADHHIALVSPGWPTSNLHRFTYRAPFTTIISESESY